MITSCIGIFISLFIYLLIGSIGYIMYGQILTSDLLNSIKPGSPLLILEILAYVLNVIMSFPITFAVLKNYIFFAVALLATEIRDTIKNVSKIVIKKVTLNPKHEIMSEKSLDSFSTMKVIQEDDKYLNVTEQIESNKNKKEKQEILEGKEIKVADLEKDKGNHFNDKIKDKYDENYEKKSLNKIDNVKNVDKELQELKKEFKESQKNEKSNHINQTEIKVNSNDTKQEEEEKSDEEDDDEDETHHHDMVVLQPWAQSFISVFIVSLIIFVANKYSNVKTVNFF